MLNPMVRRRGSYAPLFAVTGVALMGAGALSVDISLLRLADAEIQAVADAAAFAAILQLRRTDSRDVAEATAKRVIAQNHVAGLTPDATYIEFGRYESGVFSVSAGQANAVRVGVDVDVETPFASFWGNQTHNLTANAAAAVRALHAVVVMDITNSWGSAFSGARDGALEIFDQLTAAAGEADRIGLATFHNKYGVEYTPLQRTVDATANGVRVDWSNLRTAYKTTWCGGDSVMSGYDAENALPSSCSAVVPYEFSDEYGTDHAIGVQMATTMFAEQPDPSVYRAMIIVTDGQPIGVGGATKRGSVGFTDDRWRYTFAGGPSRKTQDVIDTTIALSEAAWDDDEVHTWMISYRQSSSWLTEVPQGDGYFVKASNAADLDDIFRDIAESLPVTLVE